VDEAGSSVGVRLIDESLSFKQFGRALSAIYSEGVRHGLGANGPYQTASRQSAGDPGAPVGLKAEIERTEEGEAGDCSGDLRERSSVYEHAPPVDLYHVLLRATAGALKHPEVGDTCPTANRVEQRALVISVA